MALAARSLITGLFAGLFLALFLQQGFLHAQKGFLGSTSEQSPLSGFTDMLRNSLQIATQAVRGVGSGGYKSARLAASSLHQTSTSPSTTTFTSHTKAFSTSIPAMASKSSFIQAVRDRRTIYALNKTAPIADKEIVSIVKDTILHVPSSFNSQSTRIVLLLNKEHDTFWDFVLEVLKGVVPEDQFAGTQQRISGFKAGYGTALFFEDPEPVRALEKAFAIYAHHFPTWSEHTSAIHQYVLWAALEAEGFGANLQHYNPLIDIKAQEHWNVPKDWKLRAQLVFGGKAGEAGKKEFKPVEGERLFVYGAKE